jgi:hypothetical protein
MIYDQFDDIFVSRNTNVQVGSGSIIHDYRPKDPDPKEIITGTDSQHCWFGKEKKIVFHSILMCLTNRY